MNVTILIIRECNHSFNYFQGDEEEVKVIREKIIEMRQAVHKKTEEEVSRRWGYEEGVSYLELFLKRTSKLY